MDHHSGHVNTSRSVFACQSKAPGAAWG